VARPDDLAQWNFCRGDEFTDAGGSDFEGSRRQQTGGPSKCASTQGNVSAGALVAPRLRISLGGRFRLVVAPDGTANKPAPQWPAESLSFVRARTIAPILVCTVSAPNTSPKLVSRPFLREVPWTQSPDEPFVEATHMAPRLKRPPQLGGMLEPRARRSPRRRRRPSCSSKGGVSAEAFFAAQSMP